jgi:hypothetical protein
VQILPGEASSDSDSGAAGTPRRASAARGPTSVAVVEDGVDSSDGPEGALVWADPHGSGHPIGVQVAVRLERLPLVSMQLQPPAGGQALVGKR